MKLIVGLGNPGLRYARTRHNAGFMAIDCLLARHGGKLKNSGRQALIAPCTIEGHETVLAKPLTYMNSSGLAVAQLLDAYHLDPEQDLIVLNDDIALPPGQIRIRKKGSAGGHNGLKDIIARCQTENFQRIRIGVGEKTEGEDLVEHVLGRFSPEDADRLERALGMAADAVPLLLEGQIEEAMNRYNRRPEDLP